MKVLQFPFTFVQAKKKTKERVIESMFNSTVGSGD
jgi:hypothetical protein